MAAEDIFKMSQTSTNLQNEIHNKIEFLKNNLDSTTINMSTLASNDRNDNYLGL